MVTSRETPTPSNTGGGRIGEGEYANAVAEQTVALWGVSILGISGLSGTNDLVGEVTPPIVGPYMAGMGFWLTPSANNSAAMTLDLGQGAEDFVRQDGEPFEEDDIEADVTYLVLYTGSEFRVQNLPVAADSSGTSSANLQTFTSSGTWTKPAFGSVALIRCWGAGGSGGRSIGGTTDPGGAGGGSYVERLMPLASLGNTVSVSIGAGGTAVTSGTTAGTAGGNTTFGAHVTAYGGGGGSASNSGGGGGGGGQTSAGASAAGLDGGIGGLPRPVSAVFSIDGVNNTITTLGTGGVRVAAIVTSTSWVGTGNVFGGGGGGAADTNNGVGGGAAGGASGWGGGGGGAGGTGNGGAGGTSVNGGGGGGGGSNGTGGAGGTSLFGGAGGAGGANATAGSGAQPGGGGGGAFNGNSGAGGAGQCIVVVW